MCCRTDNANPDVTPAVDGAPDVTVIQLFAHSSDPDLKDLQRSLAELTVWQIAAVVVPMIGPDADSRHVVQRAILKLSGREPVDEAIIAPVLAEAQARRAAGQPERP